MMENFRNRLEKLEKQFDILGSLDTETMIKLLRCCQDEELERIGTLSKNNQLSELEEYVKSRLNRYSYEMSKIKITENEIRIKEKIIRTKDAAEKEKLEEEYFKLIAGY